MAGTDGSFLSTVLTIMLLVETGALRMKVPYAPDALESNTLTTFSFNVCWECRNKNEVEHGTAVDCGRFAKKENIKVALGGEAWKFCARNILGAVLQQIQKGTDLITLQESGAHDPGYFLDEIFIKKNSVADRFASGDLTTNAQLETDFLIPGQVADLALDVTQLGQNIEKYSKGFHWGSCMCQIYNTESLQLEIAPRDRFHTGKFSPGRPYMMSIYRMLSVEHQPLLLSINGQAPRRWYGAKNTREFPTSKFNEFFSWGALCKYFNRHWNHQELLKKISFVVMMGDLNRVVRSNQITVGVWGDWSMASLQNKLDGTSVGTYPGFRNGRDGLITPPNNNYRIDHVLYGNVGDGKLFKTQDVRVLSFRGANSDHSAVMGQFQVASGAPSSLGNFGAGQGSAPAAPKPPVPGVPPGAVVTPGAGNVGATSAGSGGGQGRNCGLISTIDGLVSVTLFAVMML